MRRFTRPPEPARELRHVVRAGETLASLAARYGTPGGWGRLYADNRPILGTNPNLIRPGLQLRILASRERRP